MTTLSTGPAAAGIDGAAYLPSTPDTVRWGWLPGAESAPVLRVAPGSAVTIDTVSHEGIMEDQGRDPVAYFGAHGARPDEVPADQVAIAASGIVHDFDAGPHVVTGPIQVDGAVAGDLLRVRVVGLDLRAPFGVISNRHGLGCLAGEFPEGTVRHPDADVAHPDRYGSVCTFVRTRRSGGLDYGVLPFGNPGLPGAEAVFPLAPFLGVMGVAPNVTEPVPSVPPGGHGGNVDVAMLGAGSTFYLPVQVDGGLFYVGDPHYAQGDGEVALTALEAPLRATVVLDVLRGAEADRVVGALREPFGETDTYWLPLGMDRDLDEAMRKATRAAVAFLSTRVGMSRAAAMAYLSAAGDFAVSQVVDDVKGVHCKIRKSDFPAV
ncbi:acetamidase/formamidase family protein [Parafrankia sp. EUN1f]|uniref:acetamidase/formamidase family protein n=1 Tax=Parafrankia sp. EUN1f TaxID=102897 RepID=UPI0001C4437A|nr:acetamidase/formamidase family protein [Parafrankia sp. EUN1f]EFC82959.1 Acetamidase/Formamidase [Parafrankia sp. EUN1f]